MMRLEFRRQEDNRLIARFRAEDLARIPARGESVYAPSAQEPGVYAHFRVVGRAFYFDQRGGLALVNLECVEFPSAPESVSPSRSGPPAA